MEMLLDIKKKGRFVFTESARQECAYDIYFIAENDWETKYFCTVPIGSPVGILCKTFTQIHNAGVEEYQKEKENLQRQRIPKAV